MKNQHHFVINISFKHLFFFAFHLLKLFTQQNMIKKYSYQICSTHIIDRQRYDHHLLLCLPDDDFCDIFRVMMNPYHRGHSWNPYNCNMLPNRVATLSDVRYRSFQAPNNQISSRSAKSRASLALPNYNNNKYYHGSGSTHQLAHFHEHHHHDMPTAAAAIRTR